MENTKQKFNEEETLFIKKQRWFNEFVNIGTEMIKSDLGSFLKKNERDPSYIDIQKLSYDDIKIILFYAEILICLENINSMDNCSVILK